MPDDATPRRDELLSDAFYRERRGLPDARTAGGPSPLRRLLPRVLVVLVFLAAADFAARRLLTPESLLDWTVGEEGAYTVKVDHFQQQPAPDVVFLGSSRVRDGIVPEVFARDLSETWGRPARVFNLGLANAKAEECLSLVRSHLPDPPPARVVLGITGSEVVETGGFQYASRFLWTLPDAIDWWRRTPPEDRELTHVEWFSEREVGRISYVYAHRDALREAIVDGLRDGFGWFPLTDEQRVHRTEKARLQRARALSPDGYVPPDDEQPVTLDRLLRDDPASVHIPSHELDRSPEMMGQPAFTELRELAALLAAKGCRLALVETPVSEYLQRMNPVLHGDVFRARMSELAAELGIVWIPMPARITNLGDATYLDASHLSPSGARRYTRLLFRALADAGFLQDQRP